jgi:hypothetical protein
MTNFFNKKQDVMDIQLTQYGKVKYSQGDFNPKYYSFYDTDITYDGEYIGETEIQNQIVTRIKDAVSTKPIYKFVSTTSNPSVLSAALKKAIDGERCSDGQISRYNPEIESHIYKKPLGNTDLLKDKAPAWQVRTMGDSQPISGSIFYQGSGSVTLPGDTSQTKYNSNDHSDATIWHEQMIPLLDFKIEYKYNYDGDTLGESQIVDIEDEERILLEIEEKNVLSKRLGNFEIEVFIEDDPKAQKWSQLRFVNRDLVGEENIISLLNETEEDLAGDFPRLTEDMVEYWLDLRVDDEIIDRSTPEPIDVYRKDISPSGSVCD